jgi:hypothetical protein
VTSVSSPIVPPPLNVSRGLSQNKRCLVALVGDCRLIAAWNDHRYRPLPLMTPTALLVAQAIGKWNIGLGIAAGDGR